MFVTAGYINHGEKQERLLVLMRFECKSYI